MRKNKGMKDMSVYEASDFWDEHDFGEFDDVVEAEEVHFALKKKKYVGIDEKLFAAIKKKAKRLNKPADTLISEWLSEKMTPYDLVAGFTLVRSFSFISFCILGVK